MQTDGTSAGAAAGAGVMDAAAPSAIAFEHVSLAFDDRVVLRDLSFAIPPGSMTFMLGPSGAGKSVVLKLVLGLMRPDEGAIFVNGQRVDTMSERDLFRMRSDIGMVFQENALFDSLTVAENVGYRLDDEGVLSREAVRARVEEVLAFVGLAEFIDRMPATLSGGQRRRVAIARAMAPRPGLLLFDDPTTGLDPVIATTVVDEIVKVRDLERATSVVVTHQIRDAFYIARHHAERRDGNLRIVEVGDGGESQAQFLVLYEGRIYFEGRGAELLASIDPYLEEFLYNTLPPW